MKKLSIRLLLLSIPGLPLAICVGLLWCGGEYTSLRDVHEKQSRDATALYGAAYFNKTIQYKFTEVPAKRADILAMGTSRVLQFKSDDFKLSFYNAGMIAKDLTQIEIALRLLVKQHYAPKYMVLGLDQYFFNAKWNPVADQDAQYQKELTAEPTFNSPTLTVWKDILEGKFLFSRWKWNNIGINAKQNLSGFRDDGSYFNGSFEVYGIEGDKGFSETFANIEKGKARFKQAKNVNEAAIRKLTQILQLAKDKGIKVIAFVPPYPPSVWEKMKSSGKYAYVEEIPKRLEPIFKSFDFQFFDLTSFPGSVDGDFYDGYHGREELYDKIAAQLKFSELQ